MGSVKGDRRRLADGLIYHYIAFHDRFGLGLTKREHFAGLAMQGILSNGHYQAPRANKLTGMAIDALAAADALLAQLDKSE